MSRQRECTPEFAYITFWCSRSAKGKPQGFYSGLTTPSFLSACILYTLIMAPHPLDILSVEEVNKARDIVKSLHAEHKVFFRETYLDEPSKAQLTKYLEAEHAGQTPSPLARQALSQYDVLDGKGGVQSHESIIDLNSGKRVHHEIVPEEFHASLST